MKLTCDIVRDLLPTYVDGLVSGETNRAVEEHVAGCPACAGALDAMRAPERREQPERREVDYLKKQRRKRWLFALSCVAAVMAIAVVCFAAWFVPIYVWGEPVPSSGYLEGLWGTESAALSYTVTVEDNVVTVNGILLNGDGLARVKFEQEGGVVQTTVYSAPKEDFNSAAFQVSYSAGEQVEQVMVGDMIAWEDGVSVSRAAAEIYAAAQAESADMFLTVQSLEKAAGFGNQFILFDELFHDGTSVVGTIYEFDNAGNELVNIPSVYGEQRLELSLVVTRLREGCRQDGGYNRSPEQEALEAKLWDLGVILLAVLPELEEVQWTYVVEDGNSDWPGGVYYKYGDFYYCLWCEAYTVTAEEATRRLGQDVKSYGTSAAGIQWLMERLEYSVPGLRQQSLSADPAGYEKLEEYQWLEMDALYLNISCDTEVPLDKVSLRFYDKNTLYYEDSCFNLDRALLQKGALASFEIQSAVGSDELYFEYEPYFELDNAWFTVIVTDAAGTSYNLGLQEFSGCFGRSYYYTITGTPETGFELIPS